MMIKLNKFITLLILLIIINCNFQIVKADAESKALDIINRYRDIGRYTFFTTDGHLEHYPEGFCGGIQDLNDCKWDEYIEAVVLLSGIALVVGLITLVFGIIFWIFRCICFGGCNATHGFFCPKTRYDPDIGEGYKSGSVFILKIVTLVMVAGCVAVFITALKGNSSTTSGINNLSDTIFNKTSYILDELVGISIELNQTKYEQFGERVEIQNQLNQIIDYGNDIESKGETVSDNAKDVNAIRNKIIVIGLVFCVINAGTIGVAALFGLPSMARSAAMSLVFLIPFMWIVFSVHYPINSVVADICMSYNNNTGSIEQQLANYTNPIISEIFGTCQDSNNFNSSALKNLDTTVVNLIQNATSATCDKINDACQATFPRYPNDDPASIPYSQNVLDCPPSVTCGNSTIGLYIFNSTLHNFQYKCKNSANCGDTSTCDTSNPLNLMTCGWVNVTSVNECSQGNCIYNSNTQVTDAAKDIVNFYDILTSLINIWTQQFSPLFKCSSILSFIDDVQNIVCVDEVNALDLIVAPTAVFAILLTGLGITGVLGSKRFDSKMRAKK
ncbi:hypothetical protein ACTFIR_007945 [Dictyostelium discoideum]